jgi:hypothetical protein
MMILSIAPQFMKNSTPQSFNLQIGDDAPCLDYELVIQKGEINPAKKTTLRKVLEESKAAGKDLLINAGSLT